MNPTHGSSSPHAMLHLLLHCCNVDGECNDTELQTVFSIMSRLYGVDEQWMAQNSAIHHRYFTRMKHHPSCLHYLIRQINPSDPEALLWYCAQVTVADGVVSFAEELLFERLAAILQIPTEKVRAVHKMAWQFRTGRLSQEIASNGGE